MVVDALWPASTLLIALAAWQPARHAADVELSGRPLLATPAVAGLLGLALGVYDHFEPQSWLVVALSAAAVFAVFVRMALTFRENTSLLAESRELAVTDSLTGLGNRRKLLADLEAACTDPECAPIVLIVFDLDGFKRYNDTFGHPRAARTTWPYGRSYRLGGDEFCVLAGGGELGAQAQEERVSRQRILDADPALYEVGKIVRSTHERWDGAGYADGLAGEEIPLAARVIAEAIEELESCAGSQFDPAVVELLCAELAERLAAQAA